MTVNSVETPSYRYFIANLVTGSVIMEVPFGQVSWERKITTAGSFSGTISADEAQDHFSLYETTMPGKNALYVIRDGVCVWGGIVWGRDYNISDRKLSVTALEFTSYLFHRIFWKSMTIPEGTTVKDFIDTLISCVKTDQADFDDNIGYAASDTYCSVTYYQKGGSLAMLTTSDPHNFVIGDEILVGGLDDTDYDGLRTVVSIINDYQFTFATTAGSTANTPVSITKKPYAILQSTYLTLATATSINLDTDISDVLNDYTILGTGDVNTFTFRGSDAKYVGEILQNFASSGVPSYLTSDTNQTLINTRFDYFIECNYDGGSYTFTNTFKAWKVTLDSNTPIDPSVAVVSSVPLTDLYGSSGISADHYVFEHPGNIASLTIQETSEAAATRTWVVDNANDLGSNAEKYYASYTNIPYLNDGWPLLETVFTDRDLLVSSDSEVLPYALAKGYRISPPIGKYTLVVNGSLDPVVGSYKPGDWCVVVPGDSFIEYRLRPPYENRDGILVRKIISMKVNVPDNPTFPETVDLELVPEWEVTDA